MVNLRCAMFGHKPPIYGCRGWWSPGEEYGVLVYGGRDYSNRAHADVMGECARCGKRFTVAKVHVTTNTTVGVEVSPR